MQSINPATEELLERFEPFSQHHIDEALDQTRRAWNAWSQIPLSERSHCFYRLANIMRNRKTELALLASREMGKPLTEAEAEVGKCAWACDFYAEHAERFLANESVTTSATVSYIAYRPLGTILALMPWNFPYWQVFRFAAPALMAGNTVVLKHASNVTRTALEIERLFGEASFPQGSFRTVLVPGNETAALINDPRIAAVTLTGSEKAGMAVAAACGQALKKHVLELGGSDAFIVLEDADLDQAAQVAVRARFQNTGQSCIAAKRFIVVDAIAEPFLQRFVEATEQLQVGDPLDYTTHIGPLARADLRDSLEQQVEDSVQMGASVILGGQRLERKGYYYAPTILTDVTPEMPVFRDETFGPVAAVIRATDTEHALALANNSRYGLGGNIWTRNIALARKLAQQFATGNVFINAMTASDPRLPFGGIKHSGYGRELSSFGMREFVNIQTVWIGPRVEKAPQ